MGHASEIPGAVLSGDQVVLTGNADLQDPSLYAWTGWSPPVGSGPLPAYPTAADLPQLLVPHQPYLEQHPRRGVDL